MLKSKDVMTLSRDSERAIISFFIHLSAFSALGTILCLHNQQDVRHTGILWEKLKIKCKMKDYEHLKDKQRGDHIRTTAGLQSMTH